MKKRRMRTIAALLTAAVLLAALLAPALALPDGTAIAPDESSGEDYLPGSNAEQPSLTELLYDAGGEDTSVSLQNVDGAYYLFLPSCADLSETVFRFAGDPVTLTAGEGDLTVTSGQALDLDALFAEAPDGGIYEVTFSREDESLTVKVMVSAGIASMFLTSADPVNKGRAFVEEVKGNKATGRMTMLGPDGETVYAGALTQIKGRGNSTWEHLKKPYQIKLDKKTDLLETGDPGEAAKTWVLLANALDPAFIRNSLTFDLAAELGLAYTSGSRPLDLYYDGEYRGTYLLCEKTEIGSARVDINDLEKDFEDANPDVDDFDDLLTDVGTNAYGNEYHYVTGLTDPEDISGGYLLEMDFLVRAAAEKSWFTTTNGYNIVSKSPEYLSQDAIEYISGFWQEFEDALFNGGVNPDTGKSYTDYVDLDSLVRCFVIAELSQNGDAFRSSAFFYKPAGEDRLYAGPVWDFDLAYGGFDTFPSDTSLAASLTSFGRKLLVIPSFYEAVEEVYQQELHPLVVDVLLNDGAQSGRLRGFDTYQEEVTVSCQMNAVLWQRYGEAYADAADSLRAYLSRRDDFLNGMDWAKSAADWASLSSALVFVDIFPDDWYASAVSYVVDRGLIIGTGPFLFSPEIPMTRSMVVTVLYRLAGAPATAGGLVFDDVPADQRYARAVAWAAETGIVEGDPEDGLFRPDDEITRQEMAVMLYQYYTRWLGYDGAAPALPDRFLDLDSVSAEALDAMAWAVDRGIISGTDRALLLPDGYTQRCMAAALLRNFCNVIEAEQAADTVDQQ